MSILSDLLHGKITFGTAEQEIEQWMEGIVKNDPAMTAAAGAIGSDLKQAASNAIALADTALGALIAPATTVVETAVNGLITSAIGPGAVVLTPAVDSAITTMTNALKAEIDAAATKARAALAPKSTT